MGAADNPMLRTAVSAAFKRYESTLNQDSFMNDLNVLVATGRLPPEGVVYTAKSKWCVVPTLAAGRTAS